VNEIVKMALLKWLQPRNGLLDPRGLLSSFQAITAANREVEEAILHLVGKWAIQAV